MHASGDQFCPTAIRQFDSSAIRQFGSSAKQQRCIAALRKCALAAGPCSSLVPQQDSKETSHVTS